MGIGPFDKNPGNERITRNVIIYFIVMFRAWDSENVPQMFCRSIGSKLPWKQKNLVVEV